MLTINRQRLQTTLVATIRKISSTCTSEKTKTYPLQNVRVLDLTRIVAGPHCTMLLSDLGAEVIKVERPYSGDESRKWGPPFLQNSVDSVYFLSSNRNKKSVAIDIKRGSEIIVELAKECDVMVENYVPGKLDEYNLSYEKIQPQCPKLIYCSITGYGSVGPYSKKPGYDVIAASMGGLMEPATLRLRLQTTGKKVSFNAGTVDNENMNKKKSKCCCIFKKPLEFGESSSEEDEDECDNCFGHVEKKKNKKLKDPDENGDRMQESQ